MTNDQNIDLVTCPECGTETEQHRDWSEEWSITNNYCHKCDHEWAALSLQEEARVRLVFATSDRLYERRGLNFDELILLSRAEQEQRFKAFHADFPQELLEELVRHVVDVFVTTHI
jgi:RNAse (barnase) inhibitor barstar